jgi:hypothetical protein
MDSEHVRGEKEKVCSVPLIPTYHENAAVVVDVQKA